MSLLIKMVLLITYSYESLCNFMNKYGCYCCLKTKKKLQLMAVHRLFDFTIVPKIKSKSDKSCKYRLIIHDTNIIFSWEYTFSDKLITNTQNRIQKHRRGGHEIYAARFSSYLFYDHFYRAGGGMVPLPPPPESATDTFLNANIYIE